MTTASPARPGRLPLRPLTARSVVLSLLLGVHPPELPVRDIVGTVGIFGVSEATLRVALSRMVSAGDLHRTGGVYRLSQRLLDRQRRQDDAVRPVLRSWHGDWEIGVVAVAGRSPADRAGLRTELSGLRLAELREGVWLRPANLSRAWPRRLGEVVRWFAGRPDEDAADLARQLWDIEAWAASAVTLLGYLAGASHPGDRFTAAAAAVRHLLTDPVLPAELLPPHWPGDALREAYAAYQAEVRAMTS
ncbi:MAG TPA: PaaX family transcriptional regulator C-terminal domain-containing protein [Streptosporangiaceae bacterium]|jgi:phenylacetic acid degradation operon negative regulatory protein